MSSERRCWVAAGELCRGMCEPWPEFLRRVDNVVTVDKASEQGMKIG